MRSLVFAAGGFLNPEDLIRRGGLLLLTAIIFAESGLFFGFFLPGDSLLFIAGFLSSDSGGHVLPPLPIVLVCVLPGRVHRRPGRVPVRQPAGPGAVQPPRLPLLQAVHLDKAEGFFSRHGSKTIVMARFVPIVRTFAPIVAGASKMHYRTFVVFNFIGALLWAVGVTTAGYFLGQIDVVKNNIEIALVLVILLSLTPMLVEFTRHRRKAKRGVAAAAAPPAPAKVE